MTDVTEGQVAESTATGYVLDFIYFDRQLIERVAEETIAEGAPEHSFRLSWDWGWEAKNSFEVRLAMELLASRARPEHVELSMIARFRLEGDRQVLAIEKFARFNAPAIMFPYVRQQVTMLTWAGPAGPLVLPPLNVVSMMERVDPTDTTAARSPRPD